MRSNRVGIVVVVVAFIVGAVALERGDDGGAPPSATALRAAMPTVPGPEAAAGTWFCAAGTAIGAEGAAEQLVVIENAADEVRTATLTAYGDQGQTGSQVVEVPAGSRAQVAATSLVSAAWAGVLVEVDGGEVAVQHVLTGSSGRATGPCASAPSRSWYLPVGTTVLDVAHYLVLFNPFPDEAVVDLRFETDQDTRTPPELQGLVVPGRSVRAVDVSAVVTVREQLATEVQARGGLVIAEQVAVHAETADVPEGLAVLLGAPAAAPTWQLPAGPPVADGRTVAVVVYNPNETPAEVDVQVVIDDQDVNGVVEPFEITVRGGQYQVVDLRQDERVPAGVGWTGYAQSRNGVGVVAARLVRDDGTSGPAAEVTTMGAPIGATRWQLPLATVADADPASVVVTNPGAAEVTVTASTVAGGAVAPVATATDVIVPAGQRRVLDLSPVATVAGASLQVEASGPVVAEAALAWPGDAGSSSWLLLPVEGALAELPAAVVDAGPAPTVVLDGVIPDDTAPPETAPADTAPTGTGAPADTTP